MVKQERWVRIAEQEEVLEERPHVFQIDEREIVLWKCNEYLHAFDHRCLRTGGLCRWDDSWVTCPWHGSRFRFERWSFLQWASGSKGQHLSRSAKRWGILIQAPGGR